MRARPWITAFGCAFGLSVLAGCGGSSPPAQTGGAPPDLGGGAPASSGSGSGTGSAAAEPAPAPEGPPSAEVSAGLKAFDAGKYADARKSFEAATQKNPSDFGAFVDLGQTCEKLGDKAAAEAAYKSALALRADLEGATAELSSLYANDGRLDEALALARGGLAKHPGSAPLHESLGIAMAVRGDQDNATKEFEQAIKIAPSDPMLHYTFAAWLNMWKVRGAAPHLDAALQLVKADDYAMIASIGHEYRMAGEFDSCVKTFDRAIAVKDGGEVRTERALCRLGQKDDKGTLDDLQAAVAKEPSYAPAHYYLGGRLAMTKHYKEAAAEYAKYLSLEPNGSLAKAATERMKAAQDEASKNKGAPPSPPSPKKK